MLKLKTTEKMEKKKEALLVSFFVKIEIIIIV